MCQNATEENWADVVRRVHKEMAEHVRPFLASISRSEDNVNGKAHGSGVYLDIGGKPYLLTCEHVVATGLANGGRIAHLPKADDFYHAFPNPWFYEPDPVDLAVTRVSEKSWSGTDREALPISCIATSHDVAENELLMLCGYPVKPAYFSRFTGEPVLDSPLIPYTAREKPLPGGIDPNRYFALEYEMEKAQPAGEGIGKLPPAPGFSGSPIWDTGFVASGCAADWTPEHARVIGIAVRWNEGESMVLAIKAEHVRSFLLENVRKSVAYEHWRERGGPEDDSEDLEYAVRTIQELG